MFRCAIPTGINSMSLASYCGSEPSVTSQFLPRLNDNNGAELQIGVLFSWDDASLNFISAVRVGLEQVPSIVFQRKACMHIGKFCYLFAIDCHFSAAPSLLDFCVGRENLIFSWLWSFVPKVIVQVSFFALSPETLQRSKQTKSRMNHLEVW